MSPKLVLGTPLPGLSFTAFPLAGNWIQQGAESETKQSEIGTSVWNVRFAGGCHNTGPCNHFLLKIMLILGRTCMQNKEVTQLK